MREQPQHALHGSHGRVSSGERQPNKRLKLAARVDYGMNLSSARRSLSAIRQAARHAGEGDAAIREACSRPAPASSWSNQY